MIIGTRMEFGHLEKDRYRGGDISLIAFEESLVGISNEISKFLELKFEEVNGRDIYSSRLWVEPYDIFLSKYKRISNLLIDCTNKDEILSIMKEV